MIFLVGKDLGLCVLAVPRDFRKKTKGPCRERGRNTVLVSGAVTQREVGSTESKLPGSSEVLPTQEVIDDLAGRIERAYALRRAEWRRGCSTRRVWAAAALCLWQAHTEDPTVPLDSELFVASQPITESLGDPWVALTQPEAGRRYRSQVRRIVQRLRDELSREVQLAERQMREDAPTILASLSNNRRLSPLGCYIAAHRIGRADIADRFARPAAEQHHACPLYKAASLSLLPLDLYPVEERPISLGSVNGPRTFMKSIVMN
jgi:hypothetical protein